MALNWLVTQSSVQITTIVILLLTVGLAWTITRRYIKIQQMSHLFWSAGLWFFVIGVSLEVLFAFGIYSEFLIRSYLLDVALIVESLALGSMQLIQSHKIKLAYYAYVSVTTAVLLYVLSVTQIGNILTNYVVYGALPLSVILVSSAITFPAAIVLVAIAVKGYMKSGSNKLLSIIIGVITVSIAGTLYIVQYPAFLYLSEFIGILLLWYGFL